MTFTIFTNTINPHMKPLADSINKLLGDEGSFRYIYKDDINLERNKLGWKEYNNTNYALSLQNETTKDECLELINNSDVLYFGANPDLYKFVKNRIYNNANKITLFHTERLFKHGVWQLAFPHIVFRYFTQRTIPSYKKGVYTLACSSFVEDDYKIIYANTKNIIPFGYFPQYYEYDINELLNKKNNEKICIICAGRFLKWKKFDLAIKAFAKLTKEFDNIEMKILGNGLEEKNLRMLVKDLKIDNLVHFCGGQSVEQVREYFENCNIFIFPSTKMEGWGVVLNEAMNSGCACVVSNEVGAAKYLINDNENGLIFNSGDINDLINKIRFLILEEKFRNKISQNAYFTIRDKFNPDIAAKKLIEFVDMHYLME